MTLGASWSLRIHQPGNIGNEEPPKLLLNPLEALVAFTDLPFLSPTSRHFQLFDLPGSMARTPSRKLQQRQGQTHRGHSAIALTAAGLTWDQLTLNRTRTYRGFRKSGYPKTPKSSIFDGIFYHKPSTNRGSRVPLFMETRILRFLQNLI